MRGMINGTWNRYLEELQGWNADIAASFRTPAPAVGIDRDRLRTCPQSYHLYAARACPFAHRALMAHALFGLDLRLTGHRYVWGDTLSEADILLFATAIRFDTAYQGAFMILDVRWRDFPGLHAHLETMLSLPGVSETVSFADYRTHYFDVDAFTIRRLDKDGHFIVPQTPDPVFRTAVAPANIEGYLA